MSLPYHVLKVCGGVVFAARAGSIYSFNSDLEYVSAWEYPVKQQQTKGPEDSVGNEQNDSPAPEGPPTKRRKVESSETKESNGNGNSHGKGAAAQNNNKPKKKGKQYTTPADRPFVQGLYSTTDGRHLVAITGSDKTIWVFEHDGVGNLKLLSQRAMPKRPCDIAITPDNKTILSADKFGDVYGLPLLQSEEAQWAQEVASATRAMKSRSATPSTTAQPYKPQANEFTVHTQRNRKALENQKLILEQRAKDEEGKAQGPQFEHTLLLGHVSMLTAITVGTNPQNNRQFIITADRDEHIRITRSMPQTHVIEGFCLAHEEFVSTIRIPPTRPEILISGGGDDELYVWNWTSNQLLSKADLLGEAQKVSPEIDEVAVTRVFATHVEKDARTLIFVICERIPAVFCFQLKDTESRLQHIQTISLPDATNPLDVEYLSSSSSSPQLLVAVDPNSSNNVTTASEETSTPTPTPTMASSAKSVLVFTLDEQGSAWQPTDKSLVNGPEPGTTTEQDKPITVQELQKILYTTESLRKTAQDFDNF
ncbi:hypothetical protein V8F20_001583 [Naviculisporaceae sp. PSN 640]